jgi:hypothetical protein
MKSVRQIFIEHPCRPRTTKILFTMVPRVCECGCV